MIGSLTFTRDDGETFTFSAVNPPYQLTPETQLPAGLALDVSGGEYTGRNGGYTLAGRLQRRTAKIVYNVRETYSDSRSMMQLLNDAAEFFRPMTADLRIVSFDMLVQTDDRDKSAYVMRHGHVTTPFMAPLLRGGHGSYAAEFDLIFDDPLLYWADGSGVVSGDILPAALPGSKIGEVWRDGLQVWAAGLSRWEYPDQGGGGTPQTVHVVSAYQVPVAFRITGQITNPKIVNSRNGSQWSWEGTIPYGFVVTVDVDGVALDWHGNRLLNTMGGLVAAPGDNTFTLTGSDLVLDLKAAWTGTPDASWTGTPNASTSILSQDGKVVATNLVTSPKPLASALSNVGVVTTDTSNGVSVVAKNADSDSYATIPTIPVNANTTYHIAAELTQLGGPTWYNGPLFVVEWTATNTVAAVHQAIGGIKQGILQTDFTTQPTATRIDIRLYAPLDVTQQTVWRHIGLYTASDWQAMQARGVAWFDGDSDFNQGQDDVVSGWTGTPNASWTGTPNASASILSQDGKVVAKNLVTDPNMLQRVSTWSPAGSTTVVQRPDGHWVYTPDSDVTRLALFMPHITPFLQDDYVYCEWLGGTGDGWLENMDTVAKGNGWIIGKNTNPAGNKTINPILNGTPITVLKVSAYSAADYAVMQALGIKWFDGDSVFNIVTAKASVEIRGAF